jgi:hypothetical protein
MSEPRLSRQNRILMDYLATGEWISSIELRNAFSRDHGGAQLASLTKRTSELRKLGLIESKMDEYQGCRCAWYRKVQDKKVEQVTEIDVAKDTMVVTTDGVRTYEGKNMYAHFPTCNTDRVVTYGLTINKKGEIVKQLTIPNL